MVFMRALLLVTFTRLILANESCDGTTESDCFEFAVSNGVASRISGGTGSESHGRPFQAALYTHLGDSVGFCGGVLVSTDYVLTAAHCCFQHGEPVDRIQVILGAHSLYDRYENGRRVVNAQDIVVHPDWDVDTYDHDVALLRLASTAQITDTIEPVRLPYLNTSSFSFAGAAGIVSGWGIPAEGVSFIAPTLRERTMTVMTNELCGNFYFNILPPNIICGFSPASGTCKGDNGGPLTIFYTATNETVLVGIASFVQASGCNTELPSVFSRVQNYLVWISEVAGIELL